MMLRGRRVELAPFIGWEDWDYAYQLAKRFEPKMTTEQIVKEALQEGFQFYTGFANGVRAGVIFSKHYRDGLTIDGYTDSTVLKHGMAVWYSLTAAHLLLEHLLRFTEVVYARAGRKDLELHRMCKVLNMKYDHEEKDRIVYSKRRTDYKTFTWDNSQNYSESFQKT